MQPRGIFVWSMDSLCQTLKNHSFQSQENSELDLKSWLGSRGPLPFVEGILLSMDYFHKRKAPFMSGKISSD